MAVSHNDCMPYLSATLFRIDREDPALTGQLRSSIADSLADGATTRTISRPLPRKPGGTPLDIAWFHYAEQRPPAWYAGNEIIDTQHNIVIICRRARMVSISFSDTAARNGVMRTIRGAETGPFTRLTQLSSAEINAAFVEHKVRTLWLSGVHRQMLIKPDAKVISGLELESALDPLDDQSYYYSSVRSTSRNEELATNGRPAVIGASPWHARIWIGPTRSWDEFTERMALILDQAAQKIAGPLPTEPPLPILAQASRDVGSVEQPYDMALIVPELTLPGFDTNGGDERWLQQFSDAARFELHPQDASANFEVDVLWGDESLGRLAYEFDGEATGDVRLKVRKLQWNEEDDQAKALLGICRNADFLTIYFDTGHTFSRGQFFRTRFRDAQFVDWRWVNMSQDGIDVRQEKPVDGRRFAVEDIGNAADKSLFGLVARNWPGLEARNPATGWLVCDDGSMESADFIHFDNESAPPHLTLIHVKGSHSESENRGVSVSDYEVVVGQAVKNLRHIDRSNIAEKLEANKDTVLKDAVWHNGIRQQDRDGVLRVLNSAGSNMEKTVVVLQPRVRRSIYDDIRDDMQGDGPTNAEIRRMQQLDMLLLSARAECFGLGANFLVIAEDDT